MADYYDVVLGLIPLALGGVAALLVASGVSLTTAVGLAGGLSLAVVGHAMFVRAPGTGTETTRESGFQSAD